MKYVCTLRFQIQSTLLIHTIIDFPDEKKFVYVNENGSLEMMKMQSQIPPEKWIIGASNHLKNGLNELRTSENSDKGFLIMLKDFDEYDANNLNFWFQDLVWMSAKFLKSKIVSNDTIQVYFNISTHCIPVIGVVFHAHVISVLTKYKERCKQKTCCPLPLIRHQYKCLKMIFLLILGLFFSSLSETKK